jgi:spore photoproduct lyase
MMIQNLIEKFQHIYIDEQSRGSKVAQRFVSLFPEEKISFVSEMPRSEARGSLSSKEFDRSKKEIFITPFKGSFFKRCPGSKPGLACCNYFVLNLGLQCDMNCSYCYLQSFINTPVLTIYSNLDQALSELDEMGLKFSEQSMRIGTGETIDSLSLDELTLYSHELISFFKRYPNWRLEFKTKSDRVEQFLNTEHAGNVIVSWSVNPEFIVSSEEHSTASLAARLDAAEKCLARGFQIAFHIDPMVWHPEWRENYLGLVDEIVRRFEPSQIPYISLGALRFQPEQRHLMRERFGLKSYVTQAEVFTSPDGKMRYDADMRQEMFAHVIARFKEHDPLWKVFLCMETPESWISTYQAPPRRVAGLEELFDPKVPAAILADEKRDLL